MVWYGTIPYSYGSRLPFSIRPISLSIPAVCAPLVTSCLFKLPRQLWPVDSKPTLSSFRGIHSCISSNAAAAAPSSAPPPTAAAAAAAVETTQDHRKDSAWIVSFCAAMVPFTSFCYFHSRGGTARLVERVVQSPVGVYGLLALPFVSLALEKCIYDTAQAAQGIDPTIRPANRGGFPSGGAGLPSLALVPVQKELPSWFSHRAATATTTMALPSSSSSSSSGPIASLARRVTLATAEASQRRATTPTAASTATTASH
jgi:hypothetical protein